MPRDRFLKQYGSQRSVSQEFQIKGLQFWNRFGEASYVNPKYPL